MKKKLISIGVICYNEEQNISPCYSALAKIANREKKYNFEFVFSDNGSTDQSRAEIIKIAKKDRRVKGVFLSRNFGPEANSQAALDHARGDAYILYEGDMQDPAEFIFQLVRKWEEGYNVVVGVRAKIEDTFLMTRFRKIYYQILKNISSVEIPQDAGSYGIIDRKVMEAIKSMPEKYRFYRGLRAWVGFKTGYIIYHRQKRQRGKTSFNFLSYLRYMQWSFFGFSYMPIDFIFYLAILFLVLPPVILAVYLLAVLVLGLPLNGLVMVAIGISFISGLNFLALSIIAKYVQIIVEETKARPVYIVEEIVNYS